MIQVPIRRLSSRKPSTKIRVVVTGLGLVTCLGVGTQLVWNKLVEGNCGISSVKGEGYKKIPCQVAGYVPRGENIGELDLNRHVSITDQRTMSIATAYSLVAVEEALTDAKWLSLSDEDKQRTGVAVGMGMVGLEEIVTTGSLLRDRGYNRVNPHFIPNILVNMAAGHVSLKYGLQGPNHAVSTACATGLHAIGDATRFIQNGDADVMVAGGTEACIGPLAIAGFSRMRALSTNFNDRPEEASRPFDRDRDGFVMSEGTGIMVLEELSHALNRGANIHGEILGYGLSGEAFHMTAPSTEGKGAFQCMSGALRNAGINTEEIGYINAHATSTPLGDAAESKAISDLFKEHTDSLLVSSTKGATGHLLGAAGSVEAIFTLLACKHGRVPPTKNLHHPDTGFDLNYVPFKSADWSTDKRKALSNSFWIWWYKC
ncbi:hypothetical protein ScPMuIL_005595 [Solemya velum]